MLISRAEKAQSLLNDPELTAAFDAVREAIFRKIESCPIRDEEGLMNLRLQLKLLGDVKANIQSVINTGKVIQERLTFLERVKRKAHGYKY
jgi:hypothetical protein